MLEDRRPTRFLTVVGVLLPDGRLILQPGFVTDDPSGAADAPDSPLVAELLGEEGLVLLRWGVPVAPFLIERATPEQDDLVEGPDLRNQAVAGKLPYPQQTRVIRFLLRDVPVHELRVPERGPELQFESDLPREATGVRRITWRGTHPEGRDLYYIVAYSNDGGETWQPVSLPSPETELEVDFDNLPGGAGRLRILATDGANTTSVDSPPMRVPRKPCLPTIFEPQDGAELVTGDPVFLHGQGYYLEERRPELDQLEWDSSQDGPLGQGATLQVQLRPGEHRITLAAGTRRRRAATSVTVRVAPD